MKTKVLYVEGKHSEKGILTHSVSIEKVFTQIAGNLSKEKYDAAFEKLPFVGSPLGIIKNLLFYRKAAADIYHITGPAYYIALVLPKKNTILTFHDAGILRSRKGLRRFVLKKMFFELPIRKLNYITAISEATKKELIFYTGCPREKIRVIENPLQKHFFLTEEKKLFDAECPTILQIGTTRNKNVANLIKALSGMSCRLKIIGELDEQTEKLLKSNRIKYVNKLKLDNEAIRKEYQETDIVAFCSTFEGFGLPIIEAQAMQKPVITSNISPMKEVAGRGAAYAEPSDPASIRAGILRIISDAAFRDELIKYGSENIKRFQPKLIADTYENLYQEVIQTAAAENTRN